MLANWTKATTTTTGTGTLTLSAITNFPLPSKSKAIGEYVGYSIVTGDNKYESGIGKVAASDTFERTKVLSTYNGSTYDGTSGTPLSLTSGTHTICITTLAETGVEALPFPFVGLTNGAVFSTHLNSSQSNITAAAIQRHTAYPFKLETSGILTAMGINCSVAGAGSSALLGLYEPGSNSRPARRIAYISSALDTTSTGWKSQSVIANVPLNPTWYWVTLCVVAGTNPSFTGGGCNLHAFGMSAQNNLINIREDVTATTIADPFPSTSLFYVTGSNGINPYIGLTLS